ncbi:hypothetical protein LG329_04680 [Virgibacillus necropolis]|uniref:hypothetical protein n=1 Tax=Virgibacillus necropolis TaxID=163877 RepID=UPI00384ACFD1
MPLKRLVSSCVCFFLVMLLVACGSDNSLNGEGMIIELKPSEVQDFVTEKGGFIYVKSALESDNEDDKMIMNEIKRIAEKKEINFYVFDQQKHRKYIEIDLDSQAFGFYQDGTKKSDIELSRIEKKDKVAQKVSTLIQKVKNNDN